MRGYCSAFACALVFSPVRMAGQTACPEEALARARKHCERAGERRMAMGMEEEELFEI